MATRLDHMTIAIWWQCRSTLGLCFFSIYVQECAGAWQNAECTTNIVSSQKHEPSHRYTTTHGPWDKSVMQKCKRLPFAVINCECNILCSLCLILILFVTLDRKFPPWDYRILIKSPYKNRNKSMKKPTSF